MASLGGLATGGVITASALFSVTMTAVLQALPIVQVLLLLGIYALLPMIVVLSRYSLSMMVVGAMAIFTVKFWSVRSNASMSSTVVALGNSA